MVNQDVVNSRLACANRADFCVLFAFLGRFLHFKNPVKYNRRFEINRICARKSVQRSVFVCIVKYIDRIRLA
jgi:hypothetical protein